MLKNKLDFLKYGASDFRGRMNDYVDFAIDHQLLSRSTWKSFTDVFLEDSDDHDNGWRCEYFGKMMRGAALIYSYRPSEELYSVLEGAVKDLLEAQRADGRFSTYSEEKQFHGWDMWGRKYVITGLLHFYKICKDERLKEQIISALKKHADYIVQRVGDGEGKLDITMTSDHWLGVNSCSILEPFVELFTITNQKEYLDFASYIINRGGCSGGNLIELAIEDRLSPYEYPEVKAYETMSFFEGVLAYYTVVKDEKYLKAVTNFVRRVKLTDVTIIGCSGCTHELFDNSIVKQTEYSEIHMQETCVTVTWMRLLAKLYLFTFDPALMDEIERSGYNALYGSVNTENQPGYAGWERRLVDPVPFDSYSPLFNNKRGLATGGYKEFKNGGYYGCCACIAAAGVALMPLMAVLSCEGGVVLNLLEAGVITTDECRIEIQGSYPAKTKFKINVEANKAFTLYLRIPEWCEGYTVNAKSGTKKGYLEIKIEQGMAALDIDLGTSLLTHERNGKIAFTYGAIVLARDEKKEGKDISLPIPKAFTTVRHINEERGETNRIVLSYGDEQILLVDYASAGKRWMEKNSRVSVWLVTK